MYQLAVHRFLDSMFVFESSVVGHVKMPGTAAEHCAADHILAVKVKVE